MITTNQQIFKRWLKENDIKMHTNNYAFLNRTELLASFFRYPIQVAYRMIQNSIPATKISKINTLSLKYFTTEIETKIFTELNKFSFYIQENELKELKQILKDYGFWWYLDIDDLSRDYRLQIDGTVISNRNFINYFFLDKGKRIIFDKSKFSLQKKEILLRDNNLKSFDELKNILHYLLSDLINNINKDKKTYFFHFLT